MAVSFNKVILAGNLTRDPEIRTVSNERSVANFGLAINRRYKSGDEMKEEVTFVDCEAWGRTADLIGQYLTKGAPCLVEGSLRQDAWQDKEGKNRTRLKVVVDGVQFLGAGKRDAGESAPVPAPAPRNPSGGNGLDEPPFQRPLIAETWG